MAGVLIRCAVFSPPPRPATGAASPSQPLPQPPLAVSAAGAGARKPSRLGRRRNHLRPKILKTLPKPYVPARTPEEPPPDAAVPVPSSEPLSDLFEAKLPGEESPRVSESVAVGPEPAAGKLSARSVIKFGAYLAAVFLFQTICAVWVLGGNGSDSAGESKERTLANGEGRAVSGKKFSSRTRNVVYLDESDLDKRIEEIRSMAREARRSEKRGPKRDDAGDGESDDGDDDDDGGEAIPESRAAIEKEIGSRLDKLQKKLRPVRKSPGLSKNMPLEGASGLMFKKKLKFRSPLVEKHSTAPKGFQRLHDNGKTKTKSSSEVNGDGQNGGPNHGVTELSNGEKREELVDGKGHARLSDDINQEGDEAMVSPEMQENLQNDGVGERQYFPREDEEVGHTRGRTGNVDKASGKTNSVGRANLRTTGNSSLQSSRSFGDEKLEATERSAGRDVRRVNGMLKREEIKATSMSKRVKDKESDQIQEFWWLKLPCVFAILMRRGSDFEEPGGFFSLKTDPEDSDASSYTVSFEERVDANNFCFLLESFFEELGDFSVDIVPLLRKELQEAMREKTMKMLVVRKGQLKLYAGQPFSDVELALQSLVEESLSE
ncbi:hypothetical protein BT93_L3783 [Corymbia citriodora subsp. variegata]|uniref:Uncharacterized protein n=1 Tax=Corymbia citriodora subsp. variegata TaxID=360336 RepID=A0A8T0CV61_CORYI|nr:hypothetical protein BT93_L3783 [Corymbia citriodora subsp. variegata]